MSLLTDFFKPVPIKKNIFRKPDVKNCNEAVCLATIQI